MGSRRRSRGLGETRYGRSASAFSPGTVVRSAGGRTPDDQDLSAVGAGSGAAGRKRRSGPPARRGGRLAARRRGAAAVLQEDLQRRRGGVQPGADGACRYRDGDRLLGGLERLPADEHDRPDHAFSAPGELRHRRRRPRGAHRPQHQFRPGHAARRRTTSGRSAWWPAPIRCCESARRRFQLFASASKLAAPAKAGGLVRCVGNP